VTKDEIDTFFNRNWDFIQDVISRNAAKCVTTNREDIASEIYLICLDKRDKITNIKGFVSIVASNTYRWDKSQFNIRNRSQSNDIELKNISKEDEPESDIKIQRMEYAINKYMLNAEPHEKRLCELYVTEGVRSIRKLQDRLNTTFRGSAILIKEFKQKIQEYEREIKSEEIEY